MDERPDNPELEALRRELHALREDNERLRAEMHANGSMPAEFLTQALELLRQMQQYQQRIFERWDHVADGEPRPEPIVQPEAIHQVGKLAHPEWATYAGFRDSLISLQEQSGLAPERVSKEIIAGMAGVVPRTINRHMRFWHLNPKSDWPPTHWPVGHLFSAAIAASFVGVCACTHTLTGMSLMHALVGYHLRLL